MHLTVKHRPLAVVLAFALVAFCAAPVTLARADGTGVGCVVTAKLVDPCRPLLGAATNGYPDTGTDPLSQALAHEQRIGRPLDVVHTYHAFGSNTLSAGEVALATRASTTLFTNWKPSPTWSSVSADNAAIDQMAASVKSLGNHKIFMTLWHEPENDVSPGGDPHCTTTRFVGSAGTVADYRAMWRYTENRFAADGVSNVVWVMDYVNSSKWDCVVPDLYPGDDLIDWIGFNGYQPLGGNASFTATVGRFVNLLAADTDATHSLTSKPYAVVEWGSCSHTPAAETAYYQSAQAALDAGTFPNIDLYMIYDSNGGTLSSTQDLRVTYDDNHVLDTTKGAAYTQFVNDPLLVGADTLPGASSSAPSVAITPPPAGALDGRFTITATATDTDAAVTNVSLLSDGATIASTVPDATGAAAFSLDAAQLGGGGHTLVATAGDGSGATGVSAPLRVSVVAPPDLTNVATSATTATLAWAPSTAVAGFQVLRDGNLVASLPGGSTGYVDTGLSPSSSYTYAVAPLDVAGNSITPAASVTATTAVASDDTTAPSVPANVTAAAGGPTSVVVTWSASDDDGDSGGVAGYDVYRGTTLVAAVPASSLGYTDTGLAQTTTYGYTVVAFDGASNQGASSSVASATTLDGTVPNTPGKLTAALSAALVKLKWPTDTDNVGVTAYRVYRDGTVIAVTTSPLYTDTTAVQGAVNSYWVTATDAAGNVSVPSAATALAVPDKTAPSVPTGVSATAGVGGVTIRWAASTDNVAVSGYRVYRDGKLVTTLGGSVLSFADIGLLSRSTHKYTVTALDAAGNASKASAAVSVKVL